MRIISRSVHEGLVIDGDVRVKVLEITHRRVRLGIETPNQTPQYREEVIDLGDDGGDRIAATTDSQTADGPLAPAAAL
jgi:carbon storage regulator CsrA